MTTTTTASARGKANRTRGHKAERDLCKWLRPNGYPHAERAVRTGYRTPEHTSPDPGDITGTPGIIWSVKDCGVERLPVWLVELDTMTTAGDIGLLVIKRRGHANPGQWWCWLQLDQLITLIDGGQDPGFRFPVRLELGNVVLLLRAAGYGSPVEVT